MPDRIIMMRESEWRGMRETLAKCAEGWGNAVEFDLLPPSHHAAATYLRDEARAALAKSEAAATQPVAYAYVVAGECEQIEWGTDVDLPDDPALVWLYPHPTSQPRVRPLNEDDYEEIVNAAAANMRKATSGMRGQVVTVQDSLDWWVMKETERRILSALEGGNDG